MNQLRRAFFDIRHRIRARRLRGLIAGSQGPVRLHLGCGPRVLPGWINLDLVVFDADHPPDLLMDLSLGLPAPPCCADLVYSEDVIEHIGAAEGARLLRDCFTALKPGGVMRLLTPDLALFVDKYVSRDEASLAWYRDAFGCRTFGQMLNAGMREWGHKCLYDAETLRMILEEAGFRVVTTGFGESAVEALRGLDSRATADGSLSMYLDCHKD